MKTKLCANCAAVYEATGRNSKYCNSCRTAVLQQQYRQYSKRKKEARQRVKMKGPKVAPVVSLCQAAMVAREQGLTYGQWAVRQGARA